MCLVKSFARVPRRLSGKVPGGPWLQPGGSRFPSPITNGNLSAPSVSTPTAFHPLAQGWKCGRRAAQPALPTLGSEPYVRFTLQGFYPSSMRWPARNGACNIIPCDARRPGGRVAHFFSMGESISLTHRELFNALSCANCPPRLLCAFRIYANGVTDFSPGLPGGASSDAGLPWESVPPQILPQRGYGLRFIISDRLMTLHRMSPITT